MTAEEKLSEMKEKSDKAKSELARFEGQIESEQNTLENLCGTRDLEEAKAKVATMKRRYDKGLEEHNKKVEELYNSVDWGF